YPQYNDKYVDDGYNRNRTRGGGSGGGGGFNPAHQQYEPSTTTQVTIPNEMA
ncbi:unnamed protein product, partial [Rotaria magnacalcarata]